MNIKQVLASLKKKEITVREAQALLGASQGKSSSDVNASELAAGKDPITAAKNTETTVNLQSVEVQTVTEEEHYQAVQVTEINPNIVLIRMQDKVNKNTFSSELVSQLSEAFNLVRNNENYKVVILTGYDNYFASGGTQEGLMAIQTGQVDYTVIDTYRLAIDCEIPVIAAMQGHGIGAGWCLGMTCDFMIMNRNSYFTTNFMKYGFTPGFGSTLIFPEKLGLPLAQEVLFSAKQYRGDELEARGAPFDFTSPEKVLPKAIEMAKSMCKTPRESLVLLKSHMTRTIREKLPETIKQEVAMHKQTFVNKSEIKNNIEAAFNPRSKDTSNSSSESVISIANNNAVQSVTKANKVLPTKTTVKRSLAGNRETKHIEDMAGKIAQSLSEGIAIVGMSGQFPKAKNLDDFWHNIESARDCISAIPSERWSIDDFYHENPTVPGKTNCTQMGYLSDADKFDPLFFNISHNEAQLMDPQQRIFLECCWSTIENAGIDPLSLSGSNCGVFVGVGGNDYGLSLGGSELNAQRLMGSSPSILSARISYFLNLKGPSIAVETACSSSLVSIVEACNTLTLNFCDLALAGGVCILPGPAMHVMATKSGMLSRDGRCFTFDSRANGFVPGEGVGVVLLKRVSDAINDADQIKGVIRGWGINQDGKTNGITAPSVNSQTELLNNIYRRFNINPESISLLEAHGTGTKLGDPIEIEALTKSFTSYTNKTNFCAIGSVKSNIGHLLTAAGIAGVLKVLMAIKNKVLPPTINYENLNEHISLDKTPFFISQSARPWEVDSGVRRAAISSFGFSGTNAHLVIEEFEAEMPELQQPVESQSAEPVIIALSAKTEERLQAQARSICGFVRANKSLDLRSIAYTLQTGRSAMRYRMAFIASSVAEVIDVLEQYSSGATPNKLATGIAKNSKVNSSTPRSDSGYDVSDLPKKWVTGEAFDWLDLYSGNVPGRVELPTYPFEKERFWISDIIEKPDNISGSENKNKPQVHSPNSRSKVNVLIDSQEAIDGGFIFRKRISSDDYFMRDHRVNDKMLLPGMVYLEMARSAANNAYHKSVSAIKDVMWAAPVILAEGESTELIVKLETKDKFINYQVYSEQQGEIIRYSQGKLLLSDSDVSHVDAPRKFDLKTIELRCTEHKQKEGLYRYYDSVGITYGETFQVTDSLLSNHDEGLARLGVADILKKDFSNYGLHPSILDGAFRVLFWISRAQSEGGESSGPAVPFALEHLQILGPLEENCYAYARFEIDKRTHKRVPILSILNQSGTEVIRISGYAGKEFDKNTKSNAKKTADTIKVNLYQPVLRQENLKLQPEEAVLRAVNASSPIIVFDTNENFVDCLTARGVGQQHIIRVLSGDGFYRKGENTYTINPQLSRHYVELFEALKSRNIAPTKILHMWACGELGGTDDAEIFSDSDGLTYGVFSVLYIFKAISSLLSDAKSQLCFVFKSETEKLCSQYEGLSSFARSSLSSNHRFELNTVKLDTDTLQTDTAKNSLADILLCELFNSQLREDSEVCYQANTRHLRTMQSVHSPEPHANEALSLKHRGIYLITGGMGGIGRIFAKYLVENYRAQLILVGRSALSASAEVFIESLNKLGGDVSYQQCDISNKASTQAMYASIKRRFGRIDGLLHMAGVESTTPVLEAQKSDFLEVLMPKLDGTINLDVVTRNENLDFFVCFSSISSIVGDFGSCSYAYANRFMDGFVQYREQLKQQGMRHGISLSLNWPLWKDGAMALPLEAENVYFKYSGMSSLEIKDGLAAFENLLAQGINQVAIISGVTEKINHLLKISTQHTVASVGRDGEASLAHIPSVRKRQTLDEKLYVSTEDYLKILLSNVTSVPTERLNSHAFLEEYGINSIVMMELNSALEADFDSLPKTLFFEHQTIEELIQYFLENQKPRLQTLFDLTADSVQSSNIEPRESKFPSSEPVSPDPYSPAKVSSKSETAVSSASGAQNVKSNRDVAIIGLTGRYPKARDVEEFWELLKSGTDAITEVPASRWDNSQYLTEDSDEFAGKTCCNWGGFIDDIDKFDPLFFNLSPIEAQIMDPEERIFLETVWSLFENAGYTRARLENEYQGNVALFVGVMYMHYQLDQSGQSSETGLDSSRSFVANRVSHFFNLCGTSMTIDTACSSFISSVDMARTMILCGKCDLAIAGCVNLTLHPRKYIGLTQANMLARHSNSRSFGAGDGYLPSEGAGAVLLKSMEKAVSDNDHIWGVIKSSGTNHGGRTNGFAVPNPKMQERLIHEVIKESGIDPRTISYVEAAANGSPFGDPIEVNALTNAYKKYTSEHHYCAIGSVKSNIGHAEAASGLTQLSKVLLQFKHKVLVPTLELSQLNPNISFDNTPFYLQTELAEWHAPVVNINGESQQVPRRAAINSLGAGGSNGHLIVEEYLPPQVDVVPKSEQPILIVLSAKTEERLYVIAENLFNFISNKGNELTLEDIGYTLQLGREAMECRLAFVANSKAELTRILSSYCDAWQGHSTQLSSIHISKTGLAKTDSVSQYQDTEWKTIFAMLLKDRSLERLAKHWVNGANIDWKILYKDSSNRIVQLPTYPFKRTRCWKDAEPRSADTGISRSSKKVLDTLHLVGTNPIQDKIMKIVSTRLKIDSDELSCEKHLREYGVNSLIMTKIINALELQFDCKIKGREAVGLNTISALSSLVEDKLKVRVVNHDNQSSEIFYINNSVQLSNFKDTKVLAAMEELSNGQLDLSDLEKLLGGNSI